MNILTKLNLLILGVGLAAKAQAQASIDFPTEFANLSNQDVKVTISNIVKIVLGFLGLLAILGIIYGGLKIMTSGGNADQTGQGRKAVVAGLVGLIIVLAAYSIASFVVNNLANAVS